MVGVVIISHSKELALSICKLAEQATKGAHIIGVGGTGDDGKEFGTDAIAIMEAIQQVYSEDGVLLLMDMGSALLSTQTALDLLGSEMAENIRMCSAPLVEGAIVASVQSSIGADLDSITQEVLQSLNPKQTQIGDVLEDTSTTPIHNEVSSTIPPNATTKTYVIHNVHGLHARPAAAFVQLLAQYDVQVYVAMQSSPHNVVSAKSLNAIAKMNIQQGDRLLVYCWGNDVVAYIEALETLIVTEFGEKELSSEEIQQAKQHLQETSSQEQGINTPTAPQAAHTCDAPQKLISISRGLAIGKVWKVIGVNTPTFLHTNTEDIEREMQTLLTLLALAEEKIRIDITEADNSTAKSILEMHQVMLQDPELIMCTKNMIHDHKYTAAYAWWVYCNKVSHEYKTIENNQYLNERANDLIDIAIRVVRESDTVELPQMGETPPHAILFTEEITPDIISQINLKTLKGIVTKTGGITSHVAIIARTNNIPMISGLTDFDTLKQEQPVAIDANQAKIFIAPTENIVKDLQEKIENLNALKHSLYKHTSAPAVTIDGIHIDCVANIGMKDEANNLLEYGADGIGLFRSEFLFLNRHAPPDEDEHYLHYSHVARCVQGKSIVIRLLDIGGDKQIEYMNMPKENNPFLGMRGVRIYLKYKELLIAQIRAILRVALEGNISMMIPMVTDIHEIDTVQKIVEEATQQLARDNIPHASHVPLGIMIETPASVMSAYKLTHYADFFSIGTNDLTQYILAIERESTELAYLYDTCNPSVLRSIYQVSSLATQQHTPVSVCGEAGSDFEIVPLLLAMGIRKLSVTPSRIPAVKHLVRTLSVAHCKQLLMQVLEMNNPEKIRQLVSNTYEEVAHLNSII